MPRCRCCSSSSPARPSSTDLGSLSAGPGRWARPVEPVLRPVPAGAGHARVPQPGRRPHPGRTRPHPGLDRHPHRVREKQRHRGAFRPARPGGPRARRRHRRPGAIRRREVQLRDPDVLLAQRVRCPVLGAGPEDRLRRVRLLHRLRTPGAGPGVHGRRGRRHPGHPGQPVPAGEPGVLGRHRDRRPGPRRPGQPGPLADQRHLRRRVQPGAGSHRCAVHRPGAPQHRPQGAAVDVRRAQGSHRRRPRRSPAGTEMPCPTSESEREELETDYQSARKNG